LRVRSWIDIHHWHSLVRPGVPWRFMFWLHRAGLVAVCLRLRASAAMQRAVAVFSTEAPPPEACAWTHEIKTPNDWVGLVGNKVCSIPHDARALRLGSGMSAKTPSTSAGLLRRVRVCARSLAAGGAAERSQ
jgi:hypothetical protein